MGWSTENATQAYLQTLRTANKVAEPDVAEFVSALAAGSCALFMVEACAGAAGSTTLALIAAAQQTGGRVVCILRGAEELQASEAALGAEAGSVELVAGDARALLSGDYRGADFVLLDCTMEGQLGVFRAAQANAARGGGGVVVGYNAFHGDGGGSWRCGWRAELLPIGEGLRVSRVPAGGRMKSQWVVRVDEGTGEEHVFRVTATQRRGIGG